MADGDELGLTDLYAWLRQDPGTARLPVTPVAPHGASTMSALEVLDIVLSNGVAIANFAVAYAAWREAKTQGRPRSGVRMLEHGSASVDISHLSADDLAGLLKELARDGSDGLDAE
ncbi:hypothetical protein ACF09C_00275 [Streptomyces sp. NPDC014870]|uniref:effector-associated constant component EACC1 n=1 Tax=Streptomyces sp. NPDC014870 TaxID=3364925 RepID=UPI0036F50217